jgi:hypothetical protein
MLMPPAIDCHQLALTHVAAAHDTQEVVGSSPARPTVDVARHRRQVLKASKTTRSARSQGALVIDARIDGQVPQRRAIETDDADVESQVRWTP